MNQKGFIPILVIFLVLAAIGAAYYFGKISNKIQLTPSPTPKETFVVTPTLMPKQTADPTANWKTYTNNYWKITFKYPSDSLVSCPNYSTEKDGIRFWNIGFTCPTGTDGIYKMAFIGYDRGKYTEYKKPFKTESIVVDGKEAQKKTYVYDESDGPLIPLKQSIEIVISLPTGILTMTQNGNNINEQNIFDQILSTFKFIN